MPSTDLPLELDVEDVQALQAAGTPFLLLDCREPDEHATASLPGAVLIPRREIAERLYRVRFAGERPTAADRAAADAAVLRLRSALAAGYTR